MYHKVDIVTPSRWWVSVERFKYQISQLRDGYAFVHLDEFNLASNNQAVITFDDAYENVYRHAFPILKSWGLPFEIFINGGLLGDWNDFDRQEMKTRICSMEQLQEMAEAGARIQWHSWNHSQLPLLSDEEIQAQLEVGDEMRKAFPDPHLKWFAYPSGMHDERTVNHVRQKFRGALSVDAGSDSDVHQLNRITMDEDCRPGVV